MRLNGMPGEYGFKALVNGYRGQPGIGSRSWQLTHGYFFSLEEAKAEYPDDQIKWPVEVNEFGGVYVPSEGELE